jgi:hypothetical protein
MYGFGRGVTRIRLNLYAHACITDGLILYSAHEESLLRLCFLFLHVLPGYLPETESASTLCPDNVTAIVHLHIKDLVRLVWMKAMHRSKVEMNQLIYSFFVRKFSNPHVLQNILLSECVESHSSFLATVI